MVPFKKAMKVSYRLSIVTIAISLVIIRPLFAIKRSNKIHQRDSQNVEDGF